MMNLTQSPEAVVESLDSNVENGLTLTLAAERQRAEGWNECSKATSINAVQLWIDQFKSSVVILLIVAAIISGSMHEYLQLLGIIAALFTNAVIGFFTEYRARVSLLALSKMAGSTVRVRREGSELDLPVRELVRGDIVLLESGIRVPADLRILDCASFSVDESPLTGESVPVWKMAHPAHDAPNDTCMIFQGTAVLSGRATAIVTAVGNNTTIGKLGRLLQETTSGETPLTKSLGELGHQLTILVIALSAVFGIVGSLRHQSIERMLETSIALAVAAIPEGLPVTATLALAAGIRRMVKAKALVRRLPAVETLGCTTVICSDKTGTLTENKMVVTEIIINDAHIQLTGRGYDPSGEVTANGVPLAKGDKRLERILAAVCLCNDARLETHGGEEGWHIHGDPTEGCLLTAALKLGLDYQSLQTTMPRVAELPFELARRRMSTINVSPTGGCTLFCKGAPETLLPLCSRSFMDGTEVALGDQERAYNLDQNRQLAARGLRVLCVASRHLDALPDDLNTTQLESNLTLLGLVAMADRPKENVESAIKICQSAGIRVVMLTGDQPATALAIGRELGIVPQSSNIDVVLSGDEVQNLEQDQLRKALTRVSLLARVTPEMKLKIVKSLQEQGNVVAMTGDGVNDAPALRQSNIGIAMGQSGTDMARESADLVITDDNFATIVKAVEQGRITYANISKAIGYLLTASLTSVVAITLGLFANTGLFLQPLQLLFLNLIMHVLPGLGIVLQKDPENVMQRSPRRASEKLLNSYEQTQITARSALVAVVSLAAVSIDQIYFGSETSTTVALATLCLSLILQSWSWLSANGKHTARRWHDNRPMLICTVIDLVLLMLAIYTPPFQLVLNTRALNIEHLAIVLLAAAITFFLSLPIGKLSFEPSDQEAL